MKIAHVVDGYDSDLLYQEGYLVEEQLRRGHDVLVFTRHAHGGGPDQPIRLVRGQLPTLTVRLATSLRRERPDVVHVHNIVSQIAVAACLVKSLLSYPLVLDSHHSSINTRVDTPLRRMGATVFRQTIGRIMRRAANRMFAVAGPERSFTAALLGCSEQQIELIPLGVDTNVFRPDAQDRSIARTRFGLEGAFVLAHAGRLVPEKRIDLLVEAAGRVDATVLLVGALDDRLRPVIDRARDSGTRIVLPGVLAKEDLASALRASDVGVWMGLPSVSAVEALAVGLPLITSASPHYRELLGVDYPLVAANEQELVSALTELRGDPAFAATIGARNAARTAASRAWTRIADEVELLYAAAVSDTVGANPSLKSGNGS